MEGVALVGTIIIYSVLHYVGQQLVVAQFFEPSQTNNLSIHSNNNKITTNNNKTITD